MEQLRKRGGSLLKWRRVDQTARGRTRSCVPSDQPPRSSTHSAPTARRARAGTRSSRTTQRAAKYQGAPAARPEPPFLRWTTYRSVRVQTSGTRWHNQRCSGSSGGSFGCSLVVAGFGNPATGPLAVLPSLRPREEASAHVAMASRTVALASIVARRAVEGVSMGRLLRWPAIRR